MVKKYDIDILNGSKYNRLTITGEVQTKSGRNFTYICECGKTGQTTPSHIVKGVVKSCGCLHAEKSRENLKKALASPLIGTNGTHKMAGTRPYRIWTGMKTRCNNEDVREYPDYGGRGITYDPKWETFIGFWEDMKEGYQDHLTIDRTDTNGNYCKANCAWETMSVQGHHKRKKKGSSGIYVGVKERNGRFIAAFCKHYVVQELGTFATAIQAATAYDDAYEAVYGVRNNKTEKVKK